MMVLGPVVTNKDQRHLLLRLPTMNQRGDTSGLMEVLNGTTPHQRSHLLTDRQGHGLRYELQTAPGPAVLTSRRFGSQHPPTSRHCNAIRPRPFIASDRCALSVYVLFSGVAMVNESATAIAVTDPPSRGHTSELSGAAVERDASESGATTVMLPT